MPDWVEELATVFVLTKLPSVILTVALVKPPLINWAYQLRGPTDDKVVLSTAVAHVHAMVTLIKGDEQVMLISSKGR